MGKGIAGGVKEGSSSSGSGDPFPRRSPELWIASEPHVEGVYDLDLYMIQSREASVFAATLMASGTVGARLPVSKWFHACSEIPTNSAK
jgi:hypothetical protein